MSLAPSPDPSRATGLRSSALFLLLAQGTLPDFSPASPESQGIAAAELERLGAVVQGYVDEGRVVGAELLVIKNDHVVLHQGYGWRHREEEVPMEPGGVFCLRSMTKVVVGAGVQMLIDEGKLAPGDAIAKYVDAFDGERTRVITVEHLLTHTGGLPLSSLLGVQLAGVSSERDVAALAAEHGPDFAPGTRFQYSDDGADTLGCLIEAVSGKSLEDFLRARLFEPLGMRETTGVMGKDHPLRARVCSNYAGSPGAWTRYWSPRDPPLFGFLLGSQALYGTALDYARFLHLWKERGEVGGKRLLSERAVRSALEPLNEQKMPSGFEGLETRYGRLMQLLVDPQAKEAQRVVAFGHGGSDGTIAWVFPALDLMVLYFTQSRNGLTSIEFGGAVQRYLLDPLSGTERGEPVAYSAEELDAYAGYYWEEDDEELQVVQRRGERLLLELPGKTLVELASTPRRDEFRFRLSPEYRIDFERDGEGKVTAFTGVARGKAERMPRLAPAAGLPTAAELLARRKAASERIDAVGPVSLRSTLAMPSVGIEGEVVTLVDGMARRRAESDYGTLQEATLVRDGRAWSWNSKGKTEELSGAFLAQALLDHPFLPVCDWSRVYERLEVLARDELGGAAALIVRATPRAGNAHYWIVAEETGRALILFSLDEFPGMGVVGSVTRYEDWREVNGLALPFASNFRFSSSLLGSGSTKWLELETGVALAPEDFEPSTLGQ